MAAGYEVGFDHLSMHLPHCVIGQEFIVLQVRYFALILFHHGHVDHTHILVSVCISLLVT